MIFLMCMVVMASMVFMLISVIMNKTVEMLRFAINQCGTSLRFDRKTPAILKSPFKNNPKQAVDGVVLRLSFLNEIIFKATMAFNCDDWLGLELAWFELFSTCATVGSMRTSR